MKHLILFLLVFRAGFLFAQDTLVWQPISKTEPIHTLSFIGNAVDSAYFGGVWKNGKEIKACYGNNTQVYCIYKSQITFVDYNIEVWGDDIVTVYYNSWGAEKYTITFFIKYTPDELKHLFEGIPHHKHL